MTTPAQPPHILEIIDGFWIRGEGDRLQRFRGLDPTEQLDELPKVNRLLVLDRVRDDVRDIASFRIAYLAVLVAVGAIEAHFRGAMGVDGLALDVETLSLAWTSRSAIFGWLVGEFNLGWCFNTAAATKGCKRGEPLFDDIHKILDLRPGSFSRDARDERMETGNESLDGRGKGGKMRVDDREHC